MIDDDKLVEIIEKAISDNITITDPSLHDAVYMVGMDVAAVVVKLCSEHKLPKLPTDA